jgi:hypothetical protein
MGIPPLGADSLFFPFWIIASALVTNSIQAMREDGVDEVSGLLFEVLHSPMSYRNAFLHRLCSRQSLTISQHCLCTSPSDLYERKGFTDFIWTARTHSDLCWLYHNQTITILGPTHLHSLDDIYALHTVRYVYHPTPTTKMRYPRASGIQLSVIGRPDQIANIVDESRPIRMDW